MVKVTLTLGSLFLLVVLIVYVGESIGIPENLKSNLLIGGFVASLFFALFVPKTYY